MEGFDFAAQIRVRFAETDAQGVAHNSNYFVWFEVARVEFLERYAGGYQRLRDEGIESLVLESHARFLQPAVFDDRLLVHARCLDVRGARFRFEYAVERDGAMIADGWTAHARGRRGDAPPDARRPTWLARGDRYGGSFRPASSPVVVAGFGFFGFFGPTRTTSARRGSSSTRSRRRAACRSARRRAGAPRSPGPARPYRRRPARPGVERLVERAL